MRTSNDKGYCGINQGSHFATFCKMGFHQMTTRYNRPEKPWLHSFSQTHHKGEEI